MKRWFQYVLVLSLVASMASSSQAEICPMKWQSRHHQPCDRPMPSMNMAHHHATHTASGHNCCPEGASHKAAQPKCPPVEISACMSAMTCWSLDPQPAQSSSQADAIQQPVAVATLSAPLPPSRTSKVDVAPIAAPENLVFRLKEDLRV